MTTIDTTVTTIPALPCISLEGIQPFYEALGFTLTYRQKSPNLYLIFRREGFELHFFGLKGLVPEQAFTTCLVIVPEVEELHATFADGLRRLFGKLPVAGIPRITRMRPGQSRFTVVDPAGNSVIYIRRGEAEAETEEKSGLSGGSRMEKALATAARLRDFKNDDAMAANVLDKALASREPAAPTERARALAARAEIAVAMGEMELARTLGAELQTLSLSDEERERLRDELETADRLTRALAPDGESRDA